MRFFTLLLMGLFVFPAQATIKVDVFSAEIPLDIEDTENDAEQKARAAGLNQVVIKASGDKSAPENPVIQKALRGSAGMLSQVSYGELDGNQTLKMVYNPPQIQALLTKAMLPYWSDERANIAVWVVEENRFGRKILWEHSGGSYLASLNQFASRRGLPITIPVGDIDDAIGIKAIDLWGGFLEPISSVSMRYPVDAILVLRVQKLGSRDNIRWTLYDTKPELLLTSKLQPLTGNESGTSEESLEAVIDYVANYYAQKSSVKRTGLSAESIPVEFIGIHHAKSFYTVEKYLKQLQSVASVDVVKIVGDKITFDVHLLASDIEFENQVVQNRRIRKVEREFVEEVPELKIIESDNVETNPDMGIDIEGDVSTEPSVKTDEAIPGDSVVATPETDILTGEPTDEVHDIAETETVSGGEEQESEPEVAMMFEWFN